MATVKVVTVGGKVKVEGETLAEVLENELVQHIFDANKTVKLNGEAVSPENFESTPVEEGSSVTFASAQAKHGNS